MELISGILRYSIPTDHGHHYFYSCFIFCLSVSIVKHGTSYLWPSCCTVIQQSSLLTCSIIHRWV